MRLLYEFAAKLKSNLFGSCGPGHPAAHYGLPANPHFFLGAGGARISTFITPIEAALLDVGGCEYRLESGLKCAPAVCDRQGKDF
jgi:hypothetical protein